MNRRRIEPDRQRYLAGVGAITAPWPLAGIAHDARTHGIEIDIAADFQHVGMLIDQDAFESPLKQMPNLAMPPIVGLGIHAIEVLHHSRQVRPAGVNHDVVVVVHEAVGQHDRIVPIHRLPNDCQERPAVVVVFKDGFPPVAARGDVIDRTGKFDSERACHGCDTGTGLGNRQGLTLLLLLLVLVGTASAFFGVSSRCTWLVMST